MKELVSKKEDGLLFTTSLLIEQEFGMKHKNVLAKINKTMSSDNETISEFGRLNFKPTSYTDSFNREQPMYEMTEEGFAELVMGMTGDKAKVCRIAFLNEFVKMRNYIRNQATHNLEKFQAVITQQANELLLFDKREPRDLNSLAVILDKPSYYVQSDHDLLERHGYLTSKDYWQKYTVKTPTAKLGNLCIGRKGNTLLYDPKIKELIRLLHETESLFN